jgi:hypothetical protein
MGYYRIDISAFVGGDVKNEPAITSVYSRFSQEQIDEAARKTNKKD